MIQNPFLQKILGRIYSKKIAIPLITLAVFGGWFTWYVWHWEHREQVLEVYFFDVTKGSAIFVKTPHGKTMLIGGGQGSDIIRKLTTVMPFYHHAIDVLVYPADPLNEIGLVDVASRYDIGKELHIASSTGIVHEILDSLGGENITVTWSGTSTPIRITYGASSFLLVDLLDKKIQQGITSNVSSAEVVQFRSAASTKVSTNFFKEIHPKYVVVSKMPQRPKPTTVKVTVAKSIATTTKKLATKAKKSTKLLKVKKPAPPRDPAFDLFAYPTVRIFALDRKGTTKFISDGKSLRVEALGG
ncbi:MAG: hypothetical protein RIT04_456 [Candidatus Parcubacteria bacterium]